MRLGVSYYVNAVPLARGLDAHPDVELVYSTPARLTDLLRMGKLHAALVGASEYFSGNYRLIRGGALSSSKPGADAVLCAKKPLIAIRSIALDTASRTTNLVTRMLMHWLRPGAAIHYEYRPEDTCRSLSDCDACVLIGDEAVRYRHNSGYSYDLAELWREYTGYPLVFSVWLAQPGLADDQIAIIENAIQTGRREIDQIIAEESIKRSWETNQLRRYLLESLDFSWTELHEEALRMLGDKLERCGYSGDSDLICTKEALTS